MNDTVDRLVKLKKEETALGKQFTYHPGLRTTATKTGKAAASAFQSLGSTQGAGKYIPGGAAKALYPSSP